MAWDPEELTESGNPKRPPLDVVMNGEWFARRFPKAMPMCAILVVEFIDPETGEPNLVWTADFDGTAWKHLGMLETAKQDIARSLSEQD